MADDMEPEVESVEPQPEPPETPPAEPAAAPEPADPTPEPEKSESDKQIEGLAKAQQKVMQVLSHIQKKLDKGEDLNAVEQAKLEMAQQEQQAIRARLEKYDATGDTGDPDQGIDKTATKGVLTALKRLDALEAENKALREKVKSSEPDPEQAWERLEKKVPGAQKLWKDAWAEVNKLPAAKSAHQLVLDGQMTKEAFDLTFTPQAQAVFDDRASQAPTKKLPIAKAPPSSLPSGKRSVPMTGSPQAAPTYSDPYLDFVMKVSQDMDK